MSDKSLKKCTACGGLVPEQAAYPFAGHKWDCELLVAWKNEADVIVRLAAERDSARASLAEWLDVKDQLMLENSAAQTVVKAGEEMMAAAESYVDPTLEATPEKLAECNRTLNALKKALEAYRETTKEKK